MWRYGCQLVALNFQTPDPPMQLNRGKFRQNGNCGFILKPPILRAPFDPNKKVDNYTVLRVQIISAQQLPKPNRSRKGEIIDPYAELEVYGVGYDLLKKATRSIHDNGFNPIWNETFEFCLLYKELCMVRFVVYHQDVGGSEFLCSYSLSAESIQPGYRHIPLELATGETIELATLFVKVEFLHEQGTPFGVRVVTGESKVQESAELELRSHSLVRDEAGGLRMGGGSPQDSLVAGANTDLRSHLLKRISAASGLSSSIPTQALPRFSLTTSNMARRWNRDVETKVLDEAILEEEKRKKEERRRQREEEKKRREEEKRRIEEKEKRREERRKLNEERRKLREQEEQEMEEKSPGEDDANVERKRTKDKKKKNGRKSKDIEEGDEDDLKTDSTEVLKKRKSKGDKETRKSRGGDGDDDDANDKENRKSKGGDEKRKSTSKGADKDDAAAAAADDDDTKRKSKGGDEKKKS